MTTLTLPTTAAPDTLPTDADLTRAARPPVIDLRGVKRTYGAGESAVHALAGVSLRIEAGEFVAIMGASGSGKSTMMNILGCLDEPDAGDYLLDGVDVRALRPGEVARVRNRKIGFVFQSFNLISQMSAQRNVELPMAYAGVSRAERRARAKAALALVGLSDRAHHKPTEMSGGQIQRVAVARALVNAPALILADEPTGNLDSASANEVMAAFAQIHASGRTVVVVTHDADVADQTSRSVRMRDGRIVEDTWHPHPADGVRPGPASAEAPTEVMGRVGVADRVGTTDRVGMMGRAGKAGRAGTLDSPREMAPS